MSLAQTGRPRLGVAVAAGRPQCGHGAEASAISLPQAEHWRATAVSLSLQDGVQEAGFQAEQYLAAPAIITRPVRVYLLPDSIFRIAFSTDSRAHAS